MSTRRPLCALLLLAFPAFALAEVSLNGVFADWMVLQRDRPVPIWGAADPGEQVSVEFAGQHQTARAATDGTWRVTLTPLAASGENRVLTVTGDHTKTPLLVKNVLVGEVWLCGGQSNMEWALNRSTGGPEAIAVAANPLLRMGRVPHNVQLAPVASVPVKWTETVPATAKNYSAVPYWFGDRLQRELNVPVGIINNSFGGTGIQAWLPADTLAKGPWPQDFRNVMSKGKAVYEERLAKIKAERTAYEVAKAEALAKNLPAPKEPPALPSEFKGATVLWNGEVFPLLPLAIRGVAWYQGESNAYTNGEGNYADFLTALIKDWRAGFQQDDLPFVILQISRNRLPQKDPGEPGSGVPAVQEAQLKVARTTPHAALVVTNDQGESNVHYPNKLPIGERTATAALALVYGRDIVSSGPLYRGLKISGNQAILAFEHVGSGLVAHDGPLQSFVIAGADKKFVFADARIVGDTVVVSSPQVPQPVAVRYAWADLPATVNLFNKEGLPASPFRTDDWPLVKP